VDACPETSGSLEVEPDYELEFGLGHIPLDEDDVSHQVTLAVAVTPRDESPQPFSRVEAEVQGIFFLVEGVPPHVVEAIVPLNCYAMLYGVMRGIVAQATGLTEHGALWLPSVNFRALVGDTTGESATQ
jgi:preprotein translocase subunit SecB